MARQVASDEPFAPEGGPQVMPVGDTVVWAQVPTSGFDAFTLVQVPADGGAVSKVEGGAGMLPYASPWAVSRAPERRFLNLATGVEVTPTLDDRTKEFACGPVWCAGQTSDLLLAAQRANGTGRVVSGNSGRVQSMGLGGRVACGEFNLRRAEDDPVNHSRFPGRRGIVWDLQAGRAGTMGMDVGPDNTFLPYAQGGGTFIYLDQSYADGSGGEKHILDLTMIG